MRHDLVPMAFEERAPVGVQLLSNLVFWEPRGDDAAGFSGPWVEHRTPHTNECVAICLKPFPRNIGIFLLRRGGFSDFDHVEVVWVMELGARA